MSDETKESKKKLEISGICVAAGMFIGMGIGMAVGHIAPGVLIGLGAGLLGMVLVRLKSG